MQGREGGNADKRGRRDAPPKPEPISVLIVGDQSLKKRPRVTLNEEKAVEIYRRKIELLQKTSPMQTPSSSLQGQSMRISYMFDVSPKTIRDIWNRRTWQGATRHLWPEDDGQGLYQRPERSYHERFQDQVSCFLGTIFRVHIL
jgi:hypothetical protein